MLSCFLSSLYACAISIIMQELKRFMSRAMDKQVFYKYSKIVPTAGAESAIKMLSFCLADAGNAFLVPSPYDPE